MKKDPEGLLRILALNIRKLRKEKELSQEGLAELTGLHRTYVGAIERSERNVTLATLNSFARALKTSVPELLINRKEK